MSLLSSRQQSGPQTMMTSQNSFIFSSIFREFESNLISPGLLCVFCRTFLDFKLITYNYIAIINLFLEIYLKVLKVLWKSKDNKKYHNLAAKEIDWFCIISPNLLQTPDRAICPVKQFYFFFTHLLAGFWGCIVGHFGSFLLLHSQGRVKNPANYPLLQPGVVNTDVKFGLWYPPNLILGLKTNHFA